MRAWREERAHARAAAEQCRFTYEFPALEPRRSDGATAKAEPRKAARARECHAAKQHGRRRSKFSKLQRRLSERARARIGDRWWAPAREASARDLERRAMAGEGHTRSAAALPCTRSPRASLRDASDSDASTSSASSSEDEGEAVRTPPPPSLGSPRGVAPPPTPPPSAFLPSGEGRLHAAVRARDRAELQRLLVAGVQVDHCEAASRESALHVAASLGDDGALRAMLDAVRGSVAACAVASANDKRRRTPLHRAAAANAVMCGELLMAAGSPREKRDRAGDTSLHVAASAGAARVVAVLLAGGGGATASSAGRRRGSQRGVRETARFASQRNKRKETALHACVHADGTTGGPSRKAIEATASALLGAGAAAGDCDVAGVSPLCAAAARGRTGLVELLLMRKSSRSGLPPGGGSGHAAEAVVIAPSAALSPRSPLHEAARGAHAACVGLLLKVALCPVDGPEPPPAPGGDTPLCLCTRAHVRARAAEPDAREDRALATVRALIAGGASPSAANQFGESPLLLAARADDAPLVRALLTQAPSNDNGATRAARVAVPARRAHAPCCAQHSSTAPWRSRCAH